jgi:hypothetical protein
MSQLSCGVVYRLGALAIAAEAIVERVNPPPNVLPTCAYKSANTGCPTLKGWGRPKRSWITAEGSRPMQWYIVA